MIIAENLTPLEFESLVNNNHLSYLTIYAKKFLDSHFYWLLHKPTGMILHIAYENTTRLNQFIEVWGTNPCFNYGIIDLTFKYDGEIHINARLELDATHKMILESLIDAFMSFSTDHPMADVLFLT